jgi:hypothetical protein
MLRHAGAAAAGNDCDAVEIQIDVYERDAWWNQDTQSQAYNARAPFPLM